MDYMEEFNKHIEEKGLEGLLPQNLTDNILTRMLLEIESCEKNNSDTPASTLLMAILSIQNGNIIKNGIAHVTFNGENELMAKFDSYAVCVQIEGMRRSTPVCIADDSLPTLKNIFDKDRNIQMSGLD